ncbi:MAG: CPBP family intramembrane metalloprotease [Acidobacteria bacterium]|nr:CPBP family intramembrane metalloprotease [Acidobacteriota bacterium]
MDAPASETSSPEPSGMPVPHVLPAQTPGDRATALLEILLCSGYPTQIAIAQVLALGGIRPQAQDGFSLGYVALVSLIDTATLVLLMLAFLRARGEDPVAVFIGRRSLAEEARRGVPLVFVAFGIAVVIMLTIQLIAPWMHNVARNPFQDAVKTRLDVALLVLLVVVAGGVREEMQRAFLLTQFERSLGGARVGLAVTSIGFGLGHYYEGHDAVIATAALGAFWGWVYLTRRSAVAPVVSHAGFNLLQVAQFLGTR